MADKRSRKWIISWNNYPQDLTLENLKERIINYAKVNYLVLGYEKGEQETPHIQGYINFVNPQYFTPVRKLLKNNDDTYGYIEVAYGSDEQNKEYCTKQNNYIEYGEAKENNENEYQSLINDIMQDIPFLELCKKYSKYICKNYYNFKTLYNDIQKEIGIEKQNIVIYKRLIDNEKENL